MSSGGLYPSQASSRNWCDECVCGAPEGPERGIICVEDDEGGCI